jgi:hypothetical protein
MTSTPNRIQNFFRACLLLLGILSSQNESSAGSFRLTWGDSSQNADGFEIQRRSGDSDVFLSIAIVPPHEAWYTDDDLTDNTIYCYRIRAYNKDGESPYSDEFCATSSTSDSTVNTISTNITDGAVLTGPAVIWTAAPSGSPLRVEFLINGNFSGAELIRPYQFNGDPSGTLDTRLMVNGSHQLGVRAVYADNSTVELTVVVTVSNTPKPTLTVRQRLRT